MSNDSEGELAILHAPSSSLNASVALLTFVLQEHHCVILEDWIKFFDHPVDELVVHVGADAAIVLRLEKICAAYEIKFSNLGVTTAGETTENEKNLLSAQFDATTSDFACVVRLDTLPFRQEGIEWQNGAMKLLDRLDAPFLTGGALPFRADRSVDDPNYRLTQRISNCFLIIRPHVWKDLQQSNAASEAKYGRFSVEGVVEENLVARDLWGLRLLNRRDLRVLHSQEWGKRLLFVRDEFLKGRKITPFLRGHQDDFLGPNERHYLELKPPLARRFRIFVGRWRRKFFGSGRL